LKGACITKPGTKASSLFKYIDFPSQVCELIFYSYIHDSHLLFFQAPKREEFQIGEEELEKQGSDREDKWDKEEQEEEQEEKVQYCNHSPFGRIGNEGEELSQPDLHLEDIEVSAPPVPCQTSSLVHLLFMFIFSLCGTDRKLFS
jgi:hypothetical protein